MNPLNSFRFTFHQKNWGKCLLFNLANDCLLNWANSQKWQLFSLKLLFWVKIGVILWICSALQAVLSFSAWEKLRDSAHRIFILEHKMRSLVSLVMWKVNTRFTMANYFHFLNKNWLIVINWILDVMVDSLKMHMKPSAN